MLFRSVGVCARLASPKTAAVAPVDRASSSPSFPRSGLGAGEVVECCVGPSPLSVLLWPAVAARGEADGGGCVRFWCWWFGWLPSSTLLLWPALVARGAAAGRGEALVVVVLGARALSFSFVSLAGRGGEGRGRRWSVLCFCCRWCWWYPPVVLLRPAVVVRGAGSGGAEVMVLVVQIGRAHV